MSDMDQMKADCSSELQRVLSELENLRSEKQRLEGEIKKGKLISANYDENLTKLQSSQNENSKKLEKLRKLTEKEENKTLKIRNKLFEEKVVYQWLEANALVSGKWRKIYFYGLRSSQRLPASLSVKKIDHF